MKGWQGFSKGTIIFYRLDNSKITVRVETMNMTRFWQGLYGEVLGRVWIEITQGSHKVKIQGFSKGRGQKLD